MNVRKALLETLAEADENFISGAGLAEKIRVSRNAVWKAVKALEADGYSIESVTGKGYRISPENNRLSSEIMNKFLKTRYIGRKIILMDETDSTNNYAKELAADGAESGTTVISETQTSGKGRLGRSFFSPAGSGIYMSVIIRPEFSLETAQLITSCAACAAVKAAELLCGSRIDVKWVNDLYMNGRKICGILTEASLSLETSSLDYAVIGIGFNVLSTKDKFSKELRSIASSIEDETGRKISRNRLCAELMNSLEYYLENIEDKSFLNEYRSREILTGNIITANIGGVPSVGKALGIDNNAGLVIELLDGTVRTINSGEANLCRIKE